MENPRLAILFNRMMAKTITSEEREELFSLLADLENKLYVAELFTKTWKEFESKHPVFRDDEGSEMLQQILRNESVDEHPLHKIGRNFTIWRMVSVASVLLLAMVTLLFLGVFRKSPELTLTQTVEKYEIRPGTDSATITLGDGNTIILGKTGYGILAEEAGMSIHKSKDGQISYTPSSKEISNEITTTYNTITIPKGGHYQLILPDGTEVHLNSESSLRFPTRFTGNIREVELNGEAYFSVSHKLQSETIPTKGNIPFVVKTPTQQVQVLGTIFNINAYGQALVRTTLVEGSVRIRSLDGKSVMLRPGETAINKEGESDLTIIKANLDEELAWHNGYFIFNDEDIKSIMERVARWYDVEVEYKGDMRDKRFGGIFQKSKSILQLLENFKATGLIDFKIEERRVVVMAK